jgi:hypothetical protein
MLVFLLAAAAPGDGKTMGMDDWHELAIYGVGGDAAGVTYLQVHAGDLDGDGTSDDAVLKLTCADGALTDASYVISPRDSASGMPTGKRMHKPFTLVKEWGAASPELSRMKPSYDVKTIKSARTSAQDDWTRLSLAKTDGLCPASQADAAKVTKTRSNIQNN